MPNITSSNPPLLILVDGHSLAYRAYYAFAKGRDGGLKTKTGIPTSICFGFLKSLLESIASQQPQAMAIAFDLGLPTFRHEADHTYKSDRPETPEDFITDLKNLHEILDALNLPIVTAPGFEADDVLGTLAETASAAGYRVKIVSGDKDLFQLVDPVKKISVLYLVKSHLPGKSNNEINEISIEQVKEKLGILPTQVVDYKALCGDKSDQIPGVSGIGEKTAVKLLTEYGNLDNIYAALPQIKGAIKTKLEAGKDDAYHSQLMAKIVTNVPLDINLENAHLQGFDETALKPILENLELNHYLGKIKKIQQAFGGVVEEESAPSQIEELSIDEDTQLSLFSNQENQIIQKQSPSVITCQIIDSEDKLIKLVNQLKTCTNPEFPVAWDTETSDLEPRDAELVGIGCCWGINTDNVAYIPINHKSGINLDKHTVLKTLKPLLESENYPKVLQNAKFDRLVLRFQGITLAGVVFDTLLASYVVNPENINNLSALAINYLGLNLRSYGEIVPKNKDKTIADIDIATVADYCGMQVYATFQLVEKLREKLAESERLQQLLKIEQSLEPVLAEMEYTGIKIDPIYLNQLSQQLAVYLTEIEKNAYEAAGETFNLGSPKQLSQLLFDKLKLDTKKSRKIASGYSTDAATLEKMQGDHPIIDTILEYRTLSKLKSTYVDALPLLIHKDTQRVHTNFNQTGTATGRLSSSNPNMQNIPIRTVFSRQIRKAFLPESGWLMIAADYSQIELRILAHLSQEPVLLEAYHNNQDVHTVTARLLLEKETITSEERRLGKIINFGVIYGMGAYRFAREVGVKPSEGKKFIERFNQRYPLVFEYLEQRKREAIAKGYVETILGRRRYFNFEGNSLRNPYTRNPSEIELDRFKPSQLDAQLLRAAANAPIQGSSADIIKIAMVKLHKILANYQARLLLQVHDELVLEIPPDEWEELQPQIKSTMENALKLNVPLLVDIHVGENWMDAK